MSPKREAFTLKTLKNNAENSANELSTYPRLKLKDVAAELGLSCRQLIRLAKKGIPGVAKASNEKRFLWYNCPETRKWIEDWKRHPNGNKKRPAVRKRRFSGAQRFVQRLRMMEAYARNYLEALPETIAASEIERITSAAIRLRNIAGGVIREMEYRAGQL